jgi:GNAT superfamily N-acetyltransferase
MTSSLAALEHRWVAEAMIASYNHVYQVVYKTKYRELGALGISDYGDAQVAPFQIEFLAMEDDPKKVMKAIKKYKVKDRKYVLDVFHNQPSARDIKAQYAEHGLEFVRTGPILGMDLPGPMLGGAAVIREIQTKEQLEEANRHLSVENERIPAETLKDMHIHNFLAEWNGHPAGWAQLVTVFPGVGYINQLYTLTEYRNNRIGSSLITRAHEECVRLGIIRMALVPSNMAFGLYRRFGYSPLAFYTVLRPAESPAA